MDLKDKKITVVGLGDKTGVSLVRYLSKVGAKTENLWFSDMHIHVHMHLHMQGKK